jgi:ribosomal protein S18 acetylase RimI-like enzyme
VTILVPMSIEAYAHYVEVAVSAYAKDNVKSGRWPEEGALVRSQADFDSSLPQGLETPNNYLFEIKTTETGPPVGVLWFAIEEKHGHRSAFVYDIEIKPEFRRQGHASTAFNAMEVIVRELGVADIGLHVFAHNPNAQALYNRLGYKVRSINMLKNLDVGGEMKK